MERKDYLLEKLSNEEKLYLKTLIVNVRRKYIRDNYRFINGKYIDYSELKLEDSESIFDTLIHKFDKELKSAMEFEKLISNEKLYKIIRALSLKEKMMLFYLYKEQKVLTSENQRQRSDAVERPSWKTPKKRKKPGR